MRSLEVGSYGFEEIHATSDEIKAKLKIPNAERLWYIVQALRNGFSVEEVHELTFVDPWFLHTLLQIIEMEEKIRHYSRKEETKQEEDVLGDLLPEAFLRETKQKGFSDRRIGSLLGVSEDDVRRLRRKHRMGQSTK